MFIVGLTGGIGSGKSTVSQLFRELGVPIVDTDELAHQLVAPGEPAFSQIVDTFGKQVLDVNNQLNRAKLRDIVFNDEEKRERLEAILHPLIQSTALEQIKQLDHSYCILVVPLLVEKQWQHLVDRILVVDCPEALQKQRVKQRSSLSEAQINAILKSQATRQQRLALADDVISNDEGLEKLLNNVQKLHKNYLKLAQHQEYL